MNLFFIYNDYAKFHVSERGPCLLINVFFLNFCNSAYDLVIPASGKSLVKTDIQVELPEGCYGRIAPRSGLSWKHHLDVGGE